MHQDATWYGGKPQPRQLCVRWGPSPLSQKGRSPKFSAHVYCGQIAAWIKMPYVASQCSTEMAKRKIIHRIHWIHRRQHAFTDDTGMSKHRLPPYNAYYHNWQILNFTASDSSSDDIDRCFLKVLILLYLMQLAGSKFQLSITLFENAYFLTFSLNHINNATRQPRDSSFMSGSDV